MKRLMLLIALVIGAKYFLCSQRDCVRQTATCAWAVTREAPPGPRVEREPADGLPVPIVPGTRVERAEILPPRVVKPFTAPTAAPMGTETRPVVGRLSATEERARHDARLILDREVSEWLTPDIPRAWKAPAHLVDAMIEGVEIKPIDKDYGTLYEATQRVNFSPARRGLHQGRRDHQGVLHEPASPRGRRRGGRGGGLDLQDAGVRESLPTRPGLEGG